ncbi:MAG: (2Fe-2S)-binding protein [Planctomycetota bacterium]|nr:MAG: (2Fe-2S)-binding protein [Planctomycetota bacterium]
MTRPATRSLRVLELHELPDGRAQSRMVEQHAVGVVRLDGRLIAFDPLCPHKFSDLCEGLLENGAVVCPTHLWAFDLRTGACRNVPGARITLYPAREEDGWVVVDVPLPS